ARVIGGRYRVHPTPEALEQLLQMRGSEVEVQVGNGDPLGIERDVEAPRGEGCGAREELRQAARAGGRERLSIEHAFLAHDGDEEQGVDAELGGLRLDGAAVRPWEDDAEHA